MQKTIILLFFFILIGNYAFACKCQNKDDIKLDYANTEVVVRAKVLNKEFVTFSSTLDGKGLDLVCKAYQNDTEKLDFLEKDWILKTELEIIDTYKGNGLSKKIVVYTSRLSASCGYLNFEIGKEFQIYLSSTCYFHFMFKKAQLNPENYTHYWTSRCSRTKEFDLTEDRILKSLMDK